MEWEFFDDVIQVQGLQEKPQSAFQRNICLKFEIDAIGWVAGTLVQPVAARAPSATSMIRIRVFEKMFRIVSLNTSWGATGLPPVPLPRLLDARFGHQGGNGNDRL